MCLQEVVPRAQPVSVLDLAEAGRGDSNSATAFACFWKRGLGERAARWAFRTNEAGPRHRAGRQLGFGGG